MKWSYLTRWYFDRPLKAGTRLNTYEVEKCLGLGAYGMIYLCKETCSGKKYVVKQLRPSKGRKQQERDRFKDEIQLLSKINHHLVPPLTGEFCIENQYYYVMEYVEGDNIEDLLFFHNRKFTELDALNLMKQLLSIIKYLHQHNIFHTDIRPPNVIVHQGKVHLIDFGLAKQVSERDKNISNYRQDDYYDFGQMILFLLYSTFKGKKSKRRTWIEELSLHPATVKFLKKLLGISDPFANMAEIEKDLEAAIGILQEN